MEKKKMLERISKSDLSDFAELCNTLFDISITEFTLEVSEHYQWHKKGEIPKHNKRIQNQWYKSLKPFKKIDYSVYGDPYYLADCWACWKVYSRNYLREISKNTAIMEEIKDIKKIVDVGCGIGYTTLTIQELFENAEVYGTNIEDTQQWKLCKSLGVNVVPDVSDVGSVDLIFATEYFEHFEDPVTHLKELIKTCNPKYLIIANSFGTVSVGHFISQIYNYKRVPAKGFGRIFNRELRSLEYEMQKTGIYNNKPSFWKKQ